MVASGEGWTLYNADCLDVLPTLEAGSVDAVITDPPFGIGFKYASHNDTSEGYGAWLWTILDMCERAARPGSPVFVWQASLNMRRFAEWFPRNWRLFVAAKNFVQMRPTAMQYAYDPVIVWWKDGAKPYSAKTASRDFHLANTAPSARKPGSPAYVKGHPCPRPLSQVQHIIEQWVVPGGVVLDPFMGSGTTGVACLNTGRRFIGIELDPGYFDIARQRLEAASAQKRLAV